jgi:hypothetical protein
VSYALREQDKVSETLLVKWTERWTQLAQERVLDLAEFEACKCTTRFQNPVSFFENGRDRRAVPYTEGNGVQIV